MLKRRLYIFILIMHTLIIASTSSMFIWILSYSISIVRLLLVKPMCSYLSQKIRGYRLIFLTSGQLINLIIKLPSRKVLGICKLFTKAIIIIDWLSLSLSWIQNVIIEGMIIVLAIILVIKITNNIIFICR